MKSLNDGGWNCNFPHNNTQVIKIKEYKYNKKLTNCKNSIYLFEVQSEKYIYINYL